jgi:hypothetical protein
MVQKVMYNAMEEDEEDILNVKTIIVGYFGNVFGNL